MSKVNKPALSYSKAEGRWINPAQVCSAEYFKDYEEYLLYMSDGSGLYIPKEQFQQLFQVSENTVTG